VAGENRAPVPALIQRVLDKGYRFSFFEAVRLLQSQQQGSVRVGHQGPPSQEAIRFQPELDMGFPAADVTHVEQLPLAETTEQEEDPIQQYRIWTTFMSLYGAVSPLPSYYSEDLMDQEQADEGSLARPFLDLFHHRAISLFYRTWEKYRYEIQYQPDGSDAYSIRFLTLIGQDPAHASSDPVIHPARLLRYTGLLAQQPRSASALRTLLCDWFERRGIEIEQCVPRWIEVPEDQQARLGRHNSRLGEDITLGARVYNRSCTFRISLRSENLADFCSFLPPGEKRPELRELVGLMNNDCLDCELELWIEPEHIPQTRLSAETAHLGWTTWLGRTPRESAQVTFLMRGWGDG